MFKKREDLAQEGGENMIPLGRVGNYGSCGSSTTKVLVTKSSVISRVNKELYDYCASWEVKFVNIPDECVTRPSETLFCYFISSQSRTLLLDIKLNYYPRKFVTFILIIHV
jgi:hypothetical protein